MLTKIIHCSLALLAGFALTSTSLARGGNSFTGGSPIQKIDYSAPFPRTIDIAVGESIVLFDGFHGDAALYGTTNSLAVKTTDGKTGDVLGTDAKVTRLDDDTVQVRRYDAKRPGEATIVIKDSLGMDVAAIHVTVKDGGPVIDMDSLPAAITIGAGIMIKFKPSTVPGGKIFVSAQVATTDGKTGDVLRQNQLAVSPPQFLVTRPGTATLTVAFSSVPGGPITTHCIAVTVKP